MPDTHLMKADSRQYENRRRKVITERGIRRNIRNFEGPQQDGAVPLPRGKGLCKFFIKNATIFSVIADEVCSDFLCIHLLKQHN